MCVPSGGGKSTQCALLFEEQFLITGLVGVDKDAIVAAQEGGSDASCMMRPERVLR